MKKSRAKPASAKVVSSVALSEVIECCQHITTLAELLKHCERIRAAELIEPKLIGNAGGMIAAESRAVERFLQQLELSHRI